MCKHAITRARARVFGGINFGDLVKNSPIRQIKVPAKVSGCTVCIFQVCIISTSPCLCTWCAPFQLRSVQVMRDQDLQYSMAHKF